MYRRRTRTHQAIGIVLILLVSLLLQWALRAAAVRLATLSPQTVVAGILYLQTGVQPAAQNEKAQPALTVQTGQTAAVKTLPAPTPLTFSPQEAQTIAVTGACTYPYDKTALLQQPLPGDFSQSGPLVLIVHTHTTESFTPEPGQAYSELTHARTLNEDYNMIRVGRQVAAVLEAHGIGVIHETRINDHPNYNGSYDRMKTIIEENLARYPTIQMVLDLHRDAAADENGNPLPLTAAFSDGEYAQLMLVVGTDGGGLSHPDWQQNLSTGLKLQALLERSYPGLCRDLNLRRERFNQNQTPCSLLIEFGTDGNTLSQALRSADALGAALSQLILSA